MMLGLSCSSNTPELVLNTNQIPVKHWDRVIGGSAADSPMGLVATSDGGTLVVGYSSSMLSGDKSESSRGGIDYWVVKVNAEGQKIWDKTLGGSGDDYPTQAVALADGGFVIVGYSNSGISGDKTETSKGGADYWVVKINSEGQKLWDKTYGGALVDEAAAIAVTTDGGFLLGGSSTSGSGGDKTGPNYGERDYWLIRLNSSGQKLWDKTIGGRANDHLTSLAVVDTDGSFMVVGHSNSDISYDKTERNNGDKPGTPDFWVVKISGDGQKIWDKTLGGNLSDMPSAMVSDLKGGFVIVGSSNSGISSDKTEATDKLDNDFWLVSINSKGQKQWDKTLGGDQWDVAYALLRPTDGGYLVAGTSLSGVGRDKSVASTNADFWIIKLNETGQKVWDKTILGNQTETLTRLLLTSNTLLVAGASQSGLYGDKTEANKGDFDYWLLDLVFE